MPGNRGRMGVAPRARTKLVVGFAVALARSQIADLNGFSVPVNGRKFMANAHGQIEIFPQLLWGLHQQLFPIGNHTADVVRQPTVGVRDVVVSLQHNNFGIFI